MREWLATRAARKERGSELKDLIQGGFRDRPAPRKFDNQLQAIAPAVEGRLSRLLEQEFRGLARAATESLARVSGLAEGMERLLARMPLRTLEAPEGRQDDDAFQRHYLGFVSRRAKNYRTERRLKGARGAAGGPAGPRRPGAAGERRRPRGVRGRGTHARAGSRREPQGRSGGHERASLHRTVKVRHLGA
ncbi:hypothetical protein AB0K16_12730 [Nonomuraea jabiensis]